MSTVPVGTPDPAMTWRIALITPRYWPAIGGVERHVAQLAVGLAQRGIEAEVLTVDPTTSLASRAHHNGVLIRRFPALWSDERLIVSPSLSTWLWRNAGRYTLLHAHSCHSLGPLQAAIAGRRHGVPLVVTSHYHGTGHSPLRKALHLLYRPFGVWAMHRSSAIICMTVAEEDLIPRHFGSHVPTSVVPGGIDVEEVAAAQPRERTSGETLVMAGSRLEEYKQTHLLLAALPHMPAGYRVIVAGDGPARPHLEKEIGRLGMADRVQMVGHVSRGELLSWYRTADVFVSLSRMESLGLTLMEALTAGVPVVASDIPAYREVAALAPSRRVAFIPVTPSPTQVAEAVQRAVRAGRLANVQCWSLPTWREMVDGTITVYRDVIQTVARPALRPATLRG